MVTAAMTTIRLLTTTTITRAINNVSHSNNWSYYTAIKVKSNLIELSIWIGYWKKLDTLGGGLDIYATFKYLDVWFGLWLEQFLIWTLNWTHHLNLKSFAFHRCYCMLSYNSVYNYVLMCCLNKCLIFIGFPIILQYNPKKQKLINVYDWWKLQRTPGRRIEKSLNAY